jgi:hypothetical protein
MEYTSPGLIVKSKLNGYNSESCENERQKFRKFICSSNTAEIFYAYAEFPIFES